MQSQLQDPEVEQSDSDYRIATELYTPEELAEAANVQAALDDIPVLSGYEALELLQAMSPAPDPEPPAQSQTMLKLTRQSARRLAMQHAWARLRDTGLSRRERRTMWHQLNFSALARVLVASLATPEPQPPVEAGTPSAR